MVVDQRLYSGSYDVTMGREDPGEQVGFNLVVKDLLSSNYGFYPNLKNSGNIFFIIKFSFSYSLFFSS